MTKKPYVVVMLKQDHRKRYALSRNYNLMDDHTDIDACKIGDIVQVCGGRAASFCYPDWCEEYPDKAFISIWFNYYD